MATPTQVADNIEAMAARLRDLSPVTAVIASDVMTFVDDRFASGTAPDGSRWAPLSPATLARRRGSTATTLVDTGRLRSSIFGRPSATGLQFGTNVPYAAPHQTGGRRLPQRAFLPVEPSGSGYVFTSTGPGGTLWERARESIRHYIRTGEVR